MSWMPAASTASAWRSAAGAAAGSPPGAASAGAPASVPGSSRVAAPSVVSLPPGVAAGATAVRPSPAVSRCSSLPNWVCLMLSRATAQKSAVSASARCIAPRNCASLNAMAAP